MHAVSGSTTTPTMLPRRSASTTAVADGSTTDTIAAGPTENDNRSTWEMMSPPSTIAIARPS